MDVDKLYAFVETPIFTKQVERYGSMDLLLAIQADLLADPTRGDVIKGTHGARKARVGDPADKRGKRGSYRYIYVFLEHRGRIHLLFLYSKDRQADLSAEQVRMFAEMVGTIKGK
jgi:hypothetical protein